MGTPARVGSVSRVRSARGRCGAWGARGVGGERGWGPRLEAEQNGVLAWKACRQWSENHPEGRDWGVCDGEHRLGRDCRDWGWREKR